MKARAKPKTKPRVAKAKSPKRRLAKRSVLGSDLRWSIEELPAHLQVELRVRLAQAKRGEGLEDFDEALADADRMTDEMLAVATRNPR